jgi:hypothetical protein
MSLNAIVAIVIRLFAMNWFATGLTSFFGTFATWSGEWSPRGSFALFSWSIAMLILSIGAWVLAPFLGKLLTPRSAGTVEVSALSRYDLYCVAFVFAGSYFFLASVGETFQYLYYTLQVTQREHDGDPSRTRATYRLIEHSIRTVMGLIALLGADQWAKKLLRAEKKREQRSEVASPSTESSPLS